MSDLFLALADPTRRALLDRLHARGGLTLVELCDGFAMSRQGVAKHLAILEAADLVATQRAGRVKRHYLNPVPLAKIAHRWIGKFEETRLEALAGFGEGARMPGRASCANVPAPDRGRDRVDGRNG